MNVGDTFNWWTVSKINGNLITCKCKCGYIGIIKKYDLLRNKSTKCISCSSRISHTKHNKANTRIYSIWCDIKKRCYNKNCRQYKDYGGRGIDMFDRWKHNFDDFYKWSLENGYNNSQTIDRINTNGGYYPSNCRWTNMSVQALNKRCKNKLGHLGIYIIPSGKYRASIKKKGIIYNLGCFKNLEDAIKARKEKEIELYGFCL